MDEQLNSNDINVIIDSLTHYKSYVENYSGYPSYEFKQQQLERVESALKKLRALEQNISAGRD